MYLIYLREALLDLAEDYWHLLSTNEKRNIVESLEVLIEL